MHTPAQPERIALQPAEAAAAMSVSVATVRRWLATYRSTGGRAGLRHSRPAPHLIFLIFVFFEPPLPH
jgi:hypothetical protein